MLDRQERGAALRAGMHRLVSQEKDRSHLIVTVGRNLAINLETQTVRVEGHIVRIPRGQYRVLELLALREGRLVTYQTFFDELYAGKNVGKSRIRKFVFSLRKRLGNDAADYIINIERRGYILRAPC